MERIAIIGGTGVEQMPGASNPVTMEVATPFGPCAVLMLGDPASARTVFLARHGEGHSLSPSQVNYHRNIAALAALGVTRVLATNAVGSLRRELVPGTLILLDDFIDFTRNRPLSFWEGHPHRPKGMQHTDFSQPYCPELRNVLASTAVKLDLPVVNTGTYVCAEGPRYESPAEIRMFGQWGGDVVGMTGLPEAVFAREAGLCYAGIAIVTNFAAGVTEARVAHGDVIHLMDEMSSDIRRLLFVAADSIPISRNCDCARLP